MRSDGSKVDMTGWINGSTESLMTFATLNANIIWMWLPRCRLQPQQQQACKQAENNNIQGRTEICIMYCCYLPILVLLIASSEAFQRSHLRCFPTSHQTSFFGNNQQHLVVLDAVPPKSPWDELKERLGGGSDSSSAKYSEGEPDFEYRPTFEIKEGDDGKTDSLNKQRIESIKAFVIGALAGSISIAPLTYVHYADYNMAQFELSTDMAAIQAGLFAITYRYVSRKGDDNPMLSQGAVGAFAIVRTLSNIQAPSTCDAFPLTCK